MAIKINLLVVIIILSFLVRILRFDYPMSYGFAWGDGTRDYLVANHILKYHEVPLTGPYNLLYENGIRNSPFYFYLLSFLLLPFNNILTLSFLNILMQTGLILLIYLIVRKIFDQKTALLTVLLYSFNWEVLHQSDFIWQPNLMLGAMALSAWFLTQAFFKKNYFKLLLSVFFLSLSFILHSSAFPWVVVFLILSFGNRFTLKHYIGLFSLFFISQFIFYFPVLIFLLKHTISINIRESGSYFLNFSSNLQQVLSSLNLNNPLSIILIVIFLILYFWKFKDSKKRLMGLMLILGFAPILFASFFNKIRMHYLLLTIPPIIIFISRIIALQRKKNMILLGLLFFIILTGNLKFITNPVAPKTSLKMINQLSDLIQAELVDIQKKEGFTDFSFFQIKSITWEEKAFDYPTLDTILIIPLEEKLNQKFSKISDASPFNHTQINRLDYLVIACYNLRGEFSDLDCLKEFSIQNPGYVILKNLYREFPASIYLAKHE